MNNEGKKVLFIVNRYAGATYHPSIDAEIISAARVVNCSPTIQYTEGPGHGTELSRAAARAGIFDLVAAVGGDGTVNEVANGLLYSPVPMAIIPNGSGNGLARHLRIPLSVTRAVHTLFKSKVMPIDTFRMNGKLSLNVSGVGFDGHIAALFGAGKKRGLRGYALHALREFFRFREFDALVTCANQSFSGAAFVIAIANSSQYGNNARIAPAASVRDGLLHVTILKKVPAYRLDFIYALFSGNLRCSSLCNMIETDELTIHLNRDEAFHVDGEPCGRSQIFTVKVEKASLLMMIPEKTLKA